MPESVELQDDIELVFDEYYERGWTDGLPIIPPTEARVKRMVEASGRDPKQVIAVLPTRGAEATVEGIAINAVMAGCLPEYFPVVLAIIDGIGRHDFDIQAANTTTNAVAVLTVINGPIRNAINVNYGYGLFGPGWRANATIGRAVRLVQLNIAGSIPEEVSKSAHGQPGRYTMCIGEWEERSPWEPLHVELGQPADVSCVTMFHAQGTIPITETRSRRGEAIIHTIAHCMDSVGSTNVMQGHGGDSLLVLCPDHAQLMADSGYTKRMVQEQLFELTSHIPLTRWPIDRHEGLYTSGRAKDGYLSLHQDPDEFRIVVAGGAGGHHSTRIPTIGRRPRATAYPIT